MNAHPLRSLWLAHVILASTMVGTGGGVLAWIGGDKPAKAIIAGGATFATTATILIIILTFITAPGTADTPRNSTQQIPPVS